MFELSPIGKMRYRPLLCNLPAGVTRVILQSYLAEIAMLAVDSPHLWSVFSFNRSQTPAYRHIRQCQSAFSTHLITSQLTVAATITPATVLHPTDNYGPLESR